MFLPKPYKIFSSLNDKTSQKTTKTALAMVDEWSLLVTVILSWSLLIVLPR